MGNITRHLEQTKQFITKLSLWLITLYRWFISPVIGTHCRFYPSCSQYMLLAIKRFGIYHGLILGSKRLAKCHPWHSGGLDPVPNKIS
ncbi:MAG: membrane protein insertion efficiency factor YidD [Gammaproteobacteria bacterium]